MGKNRVGVIVFLSASIRTHYWCRTKDQLELRSRRIECLKQPGLLFGSKNCFLGTVNHGIWTSKITALKKPDLQILPPLDTLIARCPRRKLFFVKQTNAFLKRNAAIPLAGPAIIFERVVVILQEIRRVVLIERSVVRQCKNPPPLESHKFFCECPRIRLVVVFNISRVDKKRGIDFLHCWVNLVPLQAVISTDEIMTGGHAERKILFHTSCRCCFKPTAKNCSCRLTIWFSYLKYCYVASTRRKTFKVPLRCKVFVRSCFLPPSHFFFCFEPLFREINETNFTGGPRTRPYHVPQRSP